MTRRDRQSTTASAAIRPGPSVRGTFLVLFFLSGACGLVYEVVWMRMLTLVFGSTAFATSTILAAFFTGLALGGAWFGRLVDRGRSPILLYAALEAGVGIFAFVMPLLFAGVTEAYVAVSRQLGFGFQGVSAVRLLLSFLVLVAPATLMGGTLPVVVKFFAGRGEAVGRHVGRLYALNTFGAVVGTLGAGFFLILLLGVREAAYLAGTVNLAIAGAAFVLHRATRAPAQAARSAEDRLETPPPAPSDGEPASPRVGRVVLWAMALSGFCALAYEVFWTRALVFFLDNSTHAFTTILTSFLVGIALGSFVASWLVDGWKRLVGWLGITQVLIGGLAVLAIPVLNHSIPVFERMAGADLDATLHWKWIGLRFVNVLTVTLAPTLLMGMTFPLAARIYARSAGKLGTALGNLYAFNTVGGVLGSLAAGFLLLPLIGIQNGILLMAALNVVVGAVLLLTEPAWAYRTRVVAAVASGVLILGGGGFYLGNGATVLTSHYERMETGEVLSYEEGIGGTVKVYEDVYGDRIISVNGFPVAGTPLEYHDAQKALAHFPLLLSPVDSPRVAIIGFGAGGTSWGSMQHQVERVDCVELVPAVPRAAHWFPDVNHGVLDLPGFNLILGDGRNYALLSDREYDVISIDATSPKMAGNGSLYARDFYELLDERLSEDGVVVQWIPFHLLSDAEVRMTAKSFLAVFPHTSLWFTPLRQNVVLVGTKKELAIDVASIREKLAREGVRADMEYVNVHDEIDFLGNFVMGDEAMADYVRGARENTDNHPYLEFTPAMAYFVADLYRVRNLVNFAEARQSPMPWLVDPGEGEETAARAAARIERRFAAVEHSIKGDVLLFLREQDRAIEEYERALALDPQEKNWLNAIWRYGNPRR